MKTTLIAAALISIPLSTLAGCTAAQTRERLADHPAIAVQRLHAAQGYDYAAKFYPHPAWLYLAAEAPRTMSDHPAVVVARRERERLEQERAQARAEPVQAVATSR